MPNRFGFNNGFLDYLIGFRNGDQSWYFWRFLFWWLLYRWYSCRYGRSCRIRVIGFEYFRLFLLFRILCTEKIKIIRKFSEQIIDSFRSEMKPKSLISYIIVHYETANIFNTFL